jgi:hypothetical protein
MPDRVKLSGDSLYGELVQPQEVIVRHEVVVRHEYVPGEVPPLPELAPGVPKSQLKLSAGKRAGSLVEKLRKLLPSK